MVSSCSLPASCHCSERQAAAAVGQAAARRGEKSNQLYPCRGRPALCNDTVVLSNC